MKEKFGKKSPSQKLVDIIRHITSTIVSIIETRLGLVVIELEEEKNRLIQLLLIAGMTLLCAFFGLITLLILLIWSIDPVYRLFMLGMITTVFLGLSILGVFWIIKKRPQSTLLIHTQNQLEIDKNFLEGDK
ncbi:phage holin family protein [Candidatus Williamhamiltonella defendens]|uniref:phage holin family protein n=1 Tax=Candidatus Williamhamiltonella defendens TaxID=138072 RepID=UPI00130D7C35|nr:phage holin family protein [Candidatus Hamiltonella defensa]